MQGRRLVASQGTPALGELPEASSLSSLQQAVAVSVAACSAEVMESFDSHLQALGSLEAISSSELLDYAWPVFHSENPVYLGHFCQVNVFA